MATPEPPQFQIERDYDNRCAHARSMFHMDVQRAESLLEIALKEADEIRTSELARARREALGGVQGAL